MSIFLHFIHGRYWTARSWDWKWSEWSNGTVHFNQTGPTREKRSTSKGGPLFSKLFWLDLTDPFSFRPKFLEILVEWIGPLISRFFWAFFQNLQICMWWGLEGLVSHIHRKRKTTLFSLWTWLMAWIAIGSPHICLEYKFKVKLLLSHMFCGCPFEFSIRARSKFAVCWCKVWNRDSGISLE